MLLRTSTSCDRERLGRDARAVRQSDLLALTLAEILTAGYHGHDLQHSLWRDGMEPRDILDVARQAIREYAGQDPDKWFYANRFVFARLQLAERRTKVQIKKDTDERGSVPVPAIKGYLIEE